MRQSPALRRSPDPSTFLVAVVGDVHGQWTTQDQTALMHLAPDLVLFVGDFGNEDVAVVQAVAGLPLPKAIALGNHDAWFSATYWGRKKCPYDRHQEDRIQIQLDLIGDSHVGYGRRDFPKIGCSVVGGRPFSWGGPEWKYHDFYQQRFGISSFQESTVRITEAALTAPMETLIFLGHNGPTGLGDRPESACGRDWGQRGGDYGDPDLREAIQRAKAQSKQVALVTFGHMHHRLRHRFDRLRDRILWDADGTVYLNAAQVPRIQMINEQESHHFALVTFQQQRVQLVDSVWLSETGVIVESEQLYQAAKPALEQDQPCVTSETRTDGGI